MRTVGLPTWDCRKVWEWPFHASLVLALLVFLGLRTGTDFCRWKKKKKRKWRLGWVFSKASDSVYVTSDGRPDAQGWDRQRGRHERPWTWRYKQGSCSVDADVGYVWAAYVSRRQAHRRPHSSRFYSSVREDAFFYSSSLSFLFLFQFFCQSGMKAQGALELT